MFKVNNKGTRTTPGVVLVHLLLIWRRTGAFIVNFEYISLLVLAFPLLTLSR